MSEIFQDVTPANATWIYKKPTGFTIFPKDQQHINYHLSTKGKDSVKNSFEQLFLVFTSEKPNTQF